MAGVAFKAAAGFILLASAFDGRYATGQLPSLEDYGRCGGPGVLLCQNSTTSARRELNAFGPKWPARNASMPCSVCLPSELAPYEACR